MTVHGLSEDTCFPWDTQWIEAIISIDIRYSYSAESTTVQEEKIFSNTFYLGVPGLKPEDQIGKSQILW